MMAPRNFFHSPLMGLLSGVMQAIFFTIRSAHFRVQSRCEVTGRLLEPFLPLAHAHLSAVVEVEFRLVHELPHEEYPSTLIAQQILRRKWVWNCVWIESRARIPNTHE